jgi:hypothetical protein
MCDKPRLTVIVGAGGTINIGFPSSKCITCKIREDDFLNNLFTRLDNFWNNENPKERKVIIFEDLIFLLEELYSYKKGNENYRNHFYAVSRIIDDYKDYTSNFYLDKINECIVKIRNLIIDSTTLFDGKKNSDEYKWYTEFWKNLADKYYLDIISLNYDNTLETIFTKETYDNGFNDEVRPDNNKSTECTYFFDSKQFLKNKIKKHRIIRLHGSINFRIIKNLLIEDREDSAIKNKINELYFRKHPYKQLDLFWADNKNTNPSEPILYYEMNHMITPIVSSYNKEEKMLPEPYYTYYSLLPKIISESKNMLIIGYGFNKNDIHLNNSIKRLSQYFKDDKKYYIINYLEQPENMEKRTEKKERIMEKLFGEAEVNTYVNRKGSSIFVKEYPNVECDFYSFKDGIESGERFDNIINHFK